MPAFRLSPQLIIGLLTGAHPARIPSVLMQLLFGMGSVRGCPGSTCISLLWLESFVTSLLLFTLHSCRCTCMG